MADPDAEQEAQRLKAVAETKFKNSNLKSTLKHLCPDMEGISSMLTAFKNLQSLFNSVLSEDYKNEILVLGGDGRYFNREASQNADNYQNCSWKLSWKNLGWQSTNSDMAKKIMLDAKIDYHAACNNMETLLIHQDLSSTDLLNELLTELQREGRSKYKQNPCLRSGRS